MATNPYGAIAIKGDNPYASIAIPAGGGQGSTPSTNATVVNPSIGDLVSTTGKAIGKFAKNAGEGLLKSIPGTLSGIGEAEKKILPSYFGGDVGEGIDLMRNAAQPSNKVQGAFKGIGNAAQFLIPGEAGSIPARVLASAALGEGQAPEPSVRAALVGAGMQGAGEIAAPILRGAGEGLRIASADPAAQRLLATRHLMPGDSAQAIGEALRPSALEQPDFLKAHPFNMGELAPQNPQSVQDVADIAGRGARGRLKQFAEIRSGNENLPIDIAPVVAAQKGSPSLLTRTEAPGTVARIGRTADRYAPRPEVRETVESPLVDEYGKPFTSEKVTPGEPPRTLQFADTLRRDINRKLGSFYQKAEGNKFLARANPQVSRLEAAGNALRESEYGPLSEASGVPEENIRGIQNEYGKLSDLRDLAQRRSNQMLTRVENPPVTAHTFISSPVHTGERIIARKILGDVESPDALVRSSVDRYLHPEGTPLPMGKGTVRPIIRGVSNVAKAAGTSPAYPTTAIAGLMNYLRSNHQ